MTTEAKAKIDWNKPIRHVTGTQTLRVIGRLTSGSVVVVYRYIGGEAEFVTVVDESCTWIENVPGEKKVYFQAVCQMKGNSHPVHCGNLFESPDTVRKWFDKTRGELIGIVKTEVDLEYKPPEG